MDAMGDFVASALAGAPVWLLSCNTRGVRGFCAFARRLVWLLGAFT